VVAAWLHVSFAAHLPAVIEVLPPFSNRPLEGLNGGRPGRRGSLQLWTSSGASRCHMGRPERRCTSIYTHIFLTEQLVRIATFNVNGVNGRLPVLLRWLEKAKPDVVCLQELKAPQGNFPETAIREAGYGAVWHGQKSWNGVAILTRGTTPVETRRGLPGDADDEQSRYIEAAVNGVLIACLYLPNGNPAPGPKFDYKLRWFDRLATHAAELLAT
jgi:Endonuclease/Exonuclease/phosphatase family